MAPINYVLLSEIQNTLKIRNTLIIFLTWIMSWWCTWKEPTWLPMGTQPKQVGVFKNEDFIMSIIWNINETKGTHTTIIIQQPWKRRNHSPIIDLILWTFPCPAGSVFIITIIILENFHRHWRWASGRDGLKAWTCGEVCSWKYWSGDSEQVENLVKIFKVIHLQKNLQVGTSACCCS